LKAEMMFNRFYEGSFKKKQENNERDIIYNITKQIVTRYNNKKDQ
jgi:hypothetical protein